MKEKELKKLVVEEFSRENTQNVYEIKANEGLWDGEKYCISKYFTNKKGRILDLGCGTGRTTIPFSQKGYDVIGVDITPKMIENAKQIAGEKGLNIDYRVGDAVKLDFEDNFFDYVFFSSV